jgi:putative hemolysin
MMVKRMLIILLLVVLCMVVAGCGSGPQKYMLSKDEQQKERVKEKSGLANPATLHCMNQTGTTWQVREDHTGGQYGVCIFSDNSWCEEWDFYRGHCKQGMNVTGCEGRFGWKAVCEPEYIPVCGKIENNLTKTIMWRTFNNACKACKGSEGNQNVRGYVNGVCG